MFWYNKFKLNYLLQTSKKSLLIQNNVLKTRVMHKRNDFHLALPETEQLSLIKNNKILIQSTLYKQYFT